MFGCGTRLASLLSRLPMALANDGFARQQPGHRIILAFDDYTPWKFAYPVPDSCLGSAGSFSVAFCASEQQKPLRIAAAAVGRRAAPMTCGWIAQFQWVCSWSQASDPPRNCTADGDFLRTHLLFAPTKLVQNDSHGRSACIVGPRSCATGAAWPLRSWAGRQRGS